jgi:hypothetical protein
MAASMIPALGRDFADSPLFDFAADLARSHAALLRDDSARVAPSDEYDVRPSFEDLSRRQQLEIAETVCRRTAYREALSEALPESDGYDGWLTVAIDVNASDAEIGRRAREIILDYLERVADARGDDLAEVLA